MATLDAQRISESTPVIPLPSGLAGVGAPTEGRFGRLAKPGVASYGTIRNFNRRFALKPVGR